MEKFLESLGPDNASRLRMEAIRRGMNVIRNDDDGDVDGAEIKGAQTARTEEVLVLILEKVRVELQENPITDDIDGDVDRETISNVHSNRVSRAIDKALAKLVAAPDNLKN